jgi:hypothetical protein
MNKKNKKVLSLLIGLSILLFTIYTVNADTYYNDIFKPDQSNVSYWFVEEVYVDSLTLNETCLILVGGEQAGEYCNVSSTEITIQIPKKVWDINLISPANGYISNSNTIDFTVNIIDDRLNFCYLYLDNNNIKTINTNGTTFYSYETILTDEDIGTWYLYCEDNLNNNYTSDSYQFIIERVSSISGGASGNVFYLPIDEKKTCNLSFRNDLYIISEDLKINIDNFENFDIITSIKIKSITTNGTIIQDIDEYFDLNQSFETIYNSSYETLLLSLNKDIDFDGGLQLEITSDKCKTELINISLYDIDTYVPEETPSNNTTIKYIGVILLVLIGVILIFTGRKNNKNILGM